MAHHANPWVVTEQCLLLIVIIVLGAGKNTPGWRLVPGFGAVTLCGKGEDTMSVVGGFYPLFIIFNT
jgi:hypothetical protein